MKIAQQSEEQPAKNKMFAHIHTPLLRYFSVQYGFLGVQLTPIYLHQTRNILLFGWNLLYSAAAFWGISTLDLINTDSLIVSCGSNSATLFGFLIGNSQKLFAYLHLFTIIHFFVYGRKVVAAFDAQQFRLVYEDKRKAVIIFSSTFALSHLFFGISFFEGAQVVTWFSQNTWNLFSALTGFYSISAFSFWTYNLLHYSQFALNRYLVYLEEKYLNRRTSSRRTLSELQSIALLSERINTLLSLPFISYIILTILSFILTSSASIICRPRVQLLAYAIISFAYILYIVSLNRKSGQTFKRLCEHIRNRIKAKEVVILRTPSSSSGDSRKHLLLKRKFFSHQRCLRCYLQGRLQAVSSRRVELSECETLYAGYLDICIFNISLLNERVLWEVILFILLYVILFAQTVTKEML